MKHSNFSRVLSLVLALVMVFSMIPATAFASDSAVYSQITSADELTTGKYVLVVDSGYAPTVLDGSWVLAEAVTATDGTITDPAASLVWDITVEEGGVKLTDSNGVTVAPKGGNNNGIASGDYAWSVTCTDGAFQFAGQGEDTVILASNKGSANKFRGYKNATVSGNPGGYPSNFTLYKMVEAEAEPERVSGLVTDLTTLVEGDTVVIFNPANAKALSATYSGFYNAGVDVTFADGVLSGYGDTELWTVGISEDGTYTLSTAEGKKLSMGESYSSMPLDDVNTAWSITAAATENCFYIQNAARGNYIEWYADKNNWSSYGTIGSNEALFAQQIYLVIADSEEPSPSEPEVSEPEESEPAELPAYTLSATVKDGDVVVMYNAGSGTLVTSTASGYKLAGLSVTPADGVILTDAADAAWTVGINDDGTYTFTQGEKVLGVVQSGTYTNLSTNAADGYTAWTMEDSATANVHYLYNASLAAGSYGPYYLEYYSGWTAYSSSSPSDNQYGIEFYVLGEGGETTDPTEPSEPEESEPVEPAGDVATYMTEAPADGDTVLIYNAANTAVLGSAASGKKLSAVTAAAENNEIVLADGMAELLVTVDGEHYIFTLDGKYMTSAETGNGLSFADELTDCGKWTLELQDDGKWIIRNVGANYNGNYNQAMEYYSGFTTYGVKTTDIYKMDFYLVKAARKSGIVTELSDGDTVVIFNPANDMAMSTAYTGFYNQGTAVTLTDGVLTGWTEADIWTVGINDDGTYTFSTAAGQKLAMGESYSSMPLDEVNTAWSIEPAATESCFYIKNVARGNYVEWYADKNNWSSYYKISSEGLFAQMFYLVVDDGSSEPEGNLPAEGSQVVIYNLSAQGVLGAENDTQSIENVLTTVENEIATPDNGGVVFTVSRNGNYFRFFNETYGYLCSNGTGNNAFYSLEASEDADWTLTAGKSGGFNLESRTAKYNGTYSQYLEYYADSYKTYSMYNVTDYDIYEFFFYGVAENVSLTGGIVDDPRIMQTSSGPRKGQDWVITFWFESAFEVLPDSIEVSYSVDPALDFDDYTVLVTSEVVTGPDASGYYTLTVPAEVLDQSPDGNIYMIIYGTNINGREIGGWFAGTIADEPSIGAVTPAANSYTGTEKRPAISAEIINAGEDATVAMTVNGETVEAVYENGAVSYTPAEDLPEGRIAVTVTVTRADGKSSELSWSFTVGEKRFGLYFGQLHSHTTYSDGSGSLESALDYIAMLPESANVDFVAFTDHSNYFDTTSSANPEGALYNMGLASASSQELWREYKDAIAHFNATHDMVAIGGFEMTWSGGPGHINTFATPGIVSRNNSTLNNKTADAGMKAYYALLSQAEGIDSISQFNHPGTTFGNFTDFAYWDAVIDSRIQLVEVGNGEGQVGAGGYYPSYEQYTMALDKGWHVAPTNNQDNHKGKWGNANDARDVVLAYELTEEGIYEAIRSYRVYATEDKNLELGYSVNGFVLGSVIEEVPEVLSIEVTAYDPDSADSISKVEVIVNSGKVAHVWDDPAALSTGVLTAELAPDYSYYYIRVTQGDGDIAVTAPVWVGETLKLGISAVECGTSTPVTGEELTITTTLFNSESSEATVKSLTYTVGSQVLFVDNTGYTVPASGNLPVEFNYTPDTARVMTVTVTAVVELEGVEYTFSMDVRLDVQDASKLVYIGIDASHYNEYVNGNYKDSMGNFGALAADYAVRTVTLKTSEELIAACSNEKYVALLLTAPSRRLPAAQEALLTYTDAEIAAIKAFNERGGAVILANWSDHYENYPSVDSVANMAPDQHMAATQNAVLEALGSSLRMGDDATYDDSYNGGQAYRLYFNTYNFDSFLVDGVEVDGNNPHDRLYTEVFSYYGGSTVYTVDGTVPATVTPVVYAHATTYSVDVDGDGLGGDSVPKYAYTEGDNRLMALATEQIGDNGLIIVSGAAFMSNFEVQATIEDSGSEKNYSNYRICENLVQFLNPVTVTDIADVQAEESEGVKYTIEGTVTSNASGYDKDTAFFDCIYLQDATAGINAFPVAGNYKIGDKVRITGTTSSYQGERQIAVTKIELISEGNEVAPVAITAAELNDGSRLGSLVTLSGTVESFAYANGLVQTVMVKDSEGNVGRVFIDGYITTSYDVENLEVGAKITVTGLASYDNSFDGPAPRIRVRDRHDVVCEKHVHTEEIIPAVAPTCTETGLTEGKKCSVCGEILVAQEVVDALGHTEEVIPAVAPTCTETGLTEGKKCSVCGEILVAQEVVDALGHTEEVIPAVAPTCTETGLTEGKKCSVCGEILVAQEVVEALGHDWHGTDCSRCDAVRENPYMDVSEEHWFFEPAVELYYEGIMTGKDADHFDPAGTLTRAEWVTMLYRAAGSPEVTEPSTFADVPADAFFADAFAWAEDLGIVSGVSENMGAPYMTITREQMVTMLYRFDGQNKTEFDLSGYTDIDDVSYYAIGAFEWAVANGYINGMTATVLAPQATANRAQAATILARYLGLI